MKLLKGKVIVPTRYTNTYKVQIEFMFGDADGYKTVTMHINQDNEDLIPLLEFLDRSIARYPRGRGGYDSYNDIEGFDRFAAEEYEEECMFFWPYDPGCDTQASIESFKVTFFDEASTEYEVTIKR